MPIDGTDPTNIPFVVNAEVAVGPELKFDYPIEDSDTFIANQIRDIAPSPDGAKMAFTGPIGPAPSGGPMGPVHGHQGDVDIARRQSRRPVHRFRHVG